MHDSARTWPLFLGVIPALKVVLSLGLAYFHARKLEQKIRHSPRWKHLRAQVREYRDLSFGDPEDALKYLTLDFWLRDNIRRAMRVDVHRRKPLKILDVGCGSGLFPFVCRYWGHDAVGLDKPIAACRPAEAIVYSVMPETLGVTINRSLIRAHERMDIKETYDLITAFMICFNQHKQPNEWGHREWKFFLSDVATDLNPGGAVYLAFNRHDKRYGELRFWDRETLKLFEACGDVDRAAGTATFRREDILRTLGPPQLPLVAMPLAASPAVVPVLVTSVH
jgi:SAM-dependent methyltransferase